ncbi:MAG: hypothetical protein WCV91_00575 [Candidatus Margulisiibacteriota bacterium]
MQVFGKGINQSALLLIEHRRKAYRNGKKLPSPKQLQNDIHMLTRELQPCRFTEILDIVDRRGDATGLAAPRWFVHLMGLCHKIVRVVLQTTENQLIFQRRSADKPDSADSIDLSAGGHVPAGMGLMAAAFEEMKQEIGLDDHHLVNGRLFRLGDPHLVLVNKPLGPSFNRELTWIYGGMILPEAVRDIRFSDGEAKSVFSLSVGEAVSLLKDPQSSSSIRNSLPVFLENWDSFMRYYFIK